MDKKRVIQIMKRNALRAGILCVSCINYYHAAAYAWVYPSKSETSVATIAGTALNSANITYATPNLETGITGQLGIFCWDIGSTTPKNATVYIFDDHAHSIFIGGLNYHGLDAIIGNGVAPSGTGDYRAGVVYTNTAGDIMLNVYDVINVGTAAMSATLYSTITIAAAGSGTTYSNPHIDIIEEAGVTTTNNNFTSPLPTPLGLPNCSKFVITYQDNNGVVYGYYNDLNFTVTPASTSFPAAALPYQTPDVAAIQYNVGGVHDYARFTWADNQNNIYEAEWDVTTGTTTPPGLILTVSAPDAYYYPRIDAIDDYNINNNPAQANYEIVTDAYISGSRGIVTYNNLSSFNCTSPFLSGAYNFSSSVAAGPGAKYSVGYYTNAGGSATVQTIDYNTGMLSNGNFYQVNNSGLAYFYTYRVPLCVSASCNDGRYLLVGYSYNAAALTYKYTSNLIAFKPSAITNATLAETNIAIFPNPATVNVQVEGALPGSDYTITDMSGKLTLHGTINNTKQTINVSGLASGIYFLEAHSATGWIHGKFVKQ